MSNIVIIGINLVEFCQEILYNLNSIKFVNLKSNDNNLNVYLKKIKKYENGTYEE